MSGPPRRPLSGRSPQSLSDRLFRQGEGSSNAPLIGIVIAAIVVIVWMLFLPPFALLRSDSHQSAGDGYSVEASSSVPSLPSGMAAASRYYKIFARKNASSAVNISLPLTDAKAPARGLSFYSYQNGSWQRLAAADVSQDGTSAQGQLQSLPVNLMLLRRQGNGLLIVGSLPSGKSLSPEAAQQITVLNTAGFTPMADGSISGEAPPAVPGAQYDTIPSVQAMGGDAAKTVDAILASPPQESAHVAALAGLAGRPGNNGVELDYTSVSVQGRQAFSDFVSQLSQEVHKNHHMLGVELPAPTLSGSGWNTGAYDWTSIAKSADYVKLLPALDQSVYRKQMPDMLKYLTGDAAVDPRKLVLVTSPYSVEKSDTDTRSLTRLDALSIASQIQIQNRDQAAAGSNVTLVAANLNHDTGGSGLVWDGTTATVSFVFKVGDATHVIWLENQFSEGFKLEYAQVYHLGGVAVDDASSDPAIADLWPAVSQFAAGGTSPLQQPNPGLLVPTWLADGKPLASDGKTTFSWQAPAQPGEHTISLIVSDGVIRVTNSTQLALKLAPAQSSSALPGSAPITATPRAAAPTATPSGRLPTTAPTGAR